eukprot:12868349-Alexandrium_andersonii.AAC.1
MCIRDRVHCVRLFAACSQGILQADSRFRQPHNRFKTAPKMPNKTLCPVMCPENCVRTLCPAVSGV